MKKILILGCSYTKGSYEYEYIGYGTTTIYPERLKNHKGWWYFVDYFKDKDVTVIACPSLGYWAYYQLILFLNENKKLDYDEIWIQETYDENRPSIFNYKVIEKIFRTPKEIISNFKVFFTGPTHLGCKIFTKGKRNFIVEEVQRDVMDKIEHNSALKFASNIMPPEFIPYTVWKEFFIDVTYMCSEKIQLLCKKLNIKGYVWSMHESYMDCNHFTRLPLENMREHLYNKNLLTGKNIPGLHQTEEGNKYIAKLIDDACIDTKI